MSEILEPAQALAIRTEASSILDVISRAASDPQTDVDKLERLLAMYERIIEQGAKRAYIKALGEAQQEIPVIPERGGIKNSAGNVQSTYALWEDINDIIKPVLDRHGFALSFRTGQTPEGRILVTGVLAHQEGHSEQTTISLPADTSGSKNAVQAVGSSTSYGKRYTAQALLNMTSRGEDDDGVTATTRKEPADKQPQPNRATAATKWAADAIKTIEGFKTSGEFSLWHRSNANAIAEVRPLNEAAHKRIVEAVAKRNAYFAGMPLERA